jgi:nitrogen fixation NifU-like protein
MLDVVLSLDNYAVAAALDGLPVEKMHCPTMAISALHAAVLLYRETPRGEASSADEVVDTFRVVSQVLNQPLSQVYSAEYDL